MNIEGKTILQRAMGNETYNVLLSMAVTAVNSQPDVIPEVAREMRKFKNRNQIKVIVKTGSYGMTKKLDEAKTLSSRSIKAIVEGVNSDGETFFRINNVDSDGYRIMLALTISLITSEDTPPEKNTSSRELEKKID